MSRASDYVIINGRRQQRPRKGANHALYISHAWRKLRPIILERDNWTCQVRISPRCTPNLRARSATATVDHIIPLHLRPDLALDQDNLRAACLSCNSELGARLRNSKIAPRRPSLRYSTDW